MSTPDSRGAVDKSGGANHLLSEQLEQQQGCVAFRALTSQANGAAEQIAVWAAALADEAFTTTWALVDGLRYDRASTLEFLAQALQVRWPGSVTQAESTLLMGTRAIPCTR